MNKGKIYIEGTIRITSSGVGYVSRDDSSGKPSKDRGNSIEIANSDLNTALHKDRVRVLLHPKQKNDMASGEVADILFRYKSKFVGTITKERGVFFLVPDDKRMYANITIPGKEAEKIKKNQKVYVKIRDWSDPKKEPSGNILSVIGMKGDNDTEMRSIVLEKGLSPDFPSGVESEAKEIPSKITAEDIAQRRDFRETLTFTIDPEDAKDFDDALSYKTTTGGDIEIGIHIADVTHYVHPDSLIDKEAKERASSIYLVDRTIPMLPEVLSNDLCSLKPNEDKLTFSAVFTLSAESLQKNKVEIIDEWFGRAIIHSDRRFSYEDAQKVLDTGIGDFYDELRALNKVAKLLQKKRFAGGAIAFEQDEVKFKLNAEGKPIDAYVKERQDTNRMIEDFMLLANKRVAEFISKKDKNIKNTFVYRVHDMPDEDKISELRAFLNTLGYKLKVGKDGVSAKDINELLSDIKGTPEEELIQTATIRTMAKAVYATKNIGHFGLSFSHYTHFTSPIRRYPDIMVHRLLWRYLQGAPVPIKELRIYEAASRYSSEREQIASEAERESIKYKQIEYMSERIGKIFNGKISGVVKWGIYVEEETTHSEGLVHIKNLRGDYYRLDEKTYSLVGEKSGKTYRLGDKVKIKVITADLDRKILDYELV